MSAPESSLLPAGEAFPAGTVDAGLYPSHASGFEHSLVALAMGEACWLVEADDGHHLRVEPAALEDVRQQLERFDRENVGWPPRPVADSGPARREAPLSPWIWVVGVVAMYWAQGKWPSLTDELSLDARRVFGRDEWWRAATALWLHADVGHLVSNVCGGFLVFSAVIVTFGAKRGWAWIAVAAVAGNLAAVALNRGTDYRSIGASTGIFAALGLLTGRAVRVVMRAGKTGRGRAVMLPLASGLVVLGLFGAGGMQVDVLAHATGFAAGLILGFAAGGEMARE